MKSWFVASGIVLALLLPLSLKAQESDLSFTTLWKAGDNGYETYRIPGMVVSKKGTLLAYAAARRTVAAGDWADTDIVLKRSTDGGHTWSSSTRIAGDSHGVTDNPVAIVDQRHGYIHFLYQKNYDHCYYMRSKDDGLSFSRPIDITPVLEGFRSEYPWTVIAPGVGHAIQLRNGRLVVPVWMAIGKELAGGRRAHSPSAVAVVYSDDEGRTWKRGDVIAKDSKEMQNPNETMAVQLADGRVMVNMRTGDSRHLRAISISPDGAHRWSTPVFDTNLFDPICAASILRLSALPKDDRNRILFVNPDSQHLPESEAHGNRLRRNLTLKMSYDEGESWPVRRVIYAGSAGYSDLAVGPDKIIYCLFESAAEKEQPGNNILFTHFNLAWITGSSVQ